MDCLIKHSLSFVINRMVKRMIEDINEYPHLITTQDWQLLESLDQAVEDRQICRNQCLGCLEFFRMIRMLSKFLNGVLKEYKKSEPLVTELRRIFSIHDELHPIALALDLANSDDYVRSKLPAILVQPYEEYVRSIKGEISILAMDYFHHEQAKCHDIILAYAILEEEQAISYTPIDINEYEDIIYIDQNFASEYESNKNFQQQIENFKKMANCKFVYSPYLIEDGIKMSRVRLHEYLESVEKLTGNTMFVRSKKDLIIANESIQITRERVDLWRNATRAAEDLKLNEMNYNYWAYPHYSIKSDLPKQVNANVSEFLESLRPYLSKSKFDVDSATDKSKTEIARSLSAATIGKSFSLQDLIDRSIKYENDIQCMACIENLCQFLDLINYKTESLSKIKKVRSSLQDTEHLKHAWKADYFVTNDIRLRARGEFIYSSLRLKTKFISIEDLKGIIADQFKKSKIN